MGQFLNHMLHRAGGSPRQPGSGSRLGSWLAGLLLLMSAADAAAFKFEKRNNQTDEGDLIKSAPCGNCLDWKIVGICHWLRVSLFSVSYEWSLKVQHHIPDYIVNVYSDNPSFKGKFFDVSSWIKELFGKDFDGAHGTLRPRNASTKHAAITPEGDVNHHIDFKKADIIVNPAILVFNQLLQPTGFFCSSNEKVPYQPMFVSDISPAWNNVSNPWIALVDISGSVDPDVKETWKTPLQLFSRSPEQWGAIYPRTGYSTLPSDAQAALLAAHRASDIVINRTLPHIAVKAPSGACAERCYSQGPLELDNDTIKYQMIAPRTEDWAAPLPRNGSWANADFVNSNGSKNIAGTLREIKTGGPSFETNESLSESWAWVMWRQYTCCKKNGNISLGESPL
jgi:integrating conjugative element protein (TIGR03756 family)